MQHFSHSSPLQSKTAAADGFDMTDITEGTVYNYAIKATVTGEGLDLEPKTLPFTWKQGVEIAAAKIEYTAVPTAASCDFKLLLSAKP